MSNFTPEEQVYLQSQRFGRLATVSRNMAPNASTISSKDVPKDKLSRLLAFFMLGTHD
jgi:hypothetical protein